MEQRRASSFGAGPLRGGWGVSLALGLAALPTFTPVTAADIARHEEARTMVYITGPIVPGDEVTFQQLTRDMQRMVVTLESSGGDVETTLRIARIMRAKEATVFADGCFSACVFLYAAGVSRVGGLEGAEVGVHRIYFAQLESNLSQAQVQRRYSTSLSEVRKFLADMNVAAEFLGLMQSIPPEQMRVLSREELERFGLGRFDHVYEERAIADEAMAIGISSLEFRRRREEARRHCEKPDGSESDRSSTIRRPTCERSRIWRLSEDDYVAKTKQAADKCDAISSGERYRQCFWREMRVVGR